LEQNSFAGFAVEENGVRLLCGQRFEYLKVSIFLEIVHPVVVEMMKLVYIS
jgi:hypothetical protein